MTEDTIEVLEQDALPDRLLEIPEPPKRLNYRGHVPDWDDAYYLCVVGSRKHTPYGKNAVETLIAPLRGQNVVIVSGLALGIDALAHKVAMINNLTTIAFPGSGLHKKVLYPRMHHTLAQKIIDTGGGIFSEFDEMTTGATWTFPRRNRIMAGVSHGILVIEAAPRSGTLITARLGTEYNRDVFAVPGPIDSENSKGTNKLIAMGATPINTGDDLLDALNLKALEALPESPNITPTDPEQREIWDLLTEPLPRDTVIERCSLPTAEALQVLTAMELEGLITEELGTIRKKA